MAGHTIVFLACALTLFASSSIISADIVDRTFNVQDFAVNRLCKNQVITAVNGNLPGPAIEVQEGDTLVVHVFNKSPYNITVHWHGVFQLMSQWADGPEYVTQGPIRPGNSYTYKFSITGQEGTLWWHAHSSWLRGTVHGALIIRPRSERLYPFPKPYGEIPIVLGEWYNGNIVDVEKQALATGGTPNSSDAFTINGQPGDLYPCSSPNTYKLAVVGGQTYLLRIINAALNNQLFFKIANHKMTVVAVDASYTNPYKTDLVVVAPGQTVDVFLKADQGPAQYYMAAHPYVSAVGGTFDNTTTTGIITYNGASTSSKPIMPILPAFNDTPTAHKFYTALTSLVTGPFWVPVPSVVDNRMFVTVSSSLTPCDRPGNTPCDGPFGQKQAFSMNNASFQFPTRLSMLEAFFRNIGGVYTTDFPNNPPVQFDYTNEKNTNNSALFMTTKSTKQVKFNSTVEMVLQNTALLGIENHPMHLHGFNFHVLAQGFGNFNAAVDSESFNYKNPQERNTIAVPSGGLAVIRFRMNNPGVWLMHCHLDEHLPGLAMAFAVENGPTPWTRLPPPPQGLPKC